MSIITSRKKLLAIALLPIFLLPASVQAQPAAQPLVELVELAKQHHRRFLVQQNIYKTEKEAAPIARSELLPQAQASLTQAGTADSTGDWTADVSVNQILYNQPRWQLWQAAKEQARLAEDNLSSQQQNLHRDVILAWLDIQFAATVLRLVQARRKTLRAQLERTEALAASGQVIEADVLFARAALASAVSQAAQAQHDLAVAHDVMHDYTQAAAAAKNLTDSQSLPVLPPLSVWQQQAEQNNPALKAARRQIAYVRHRLQAAEGAKLPRLSFRAGLNAAGSLSDTSESWQLVLEQWLFTGGNLSAERRRLIAQTDTATAQYAALLSENAAAIRQLHGQMRADITRIQSLSEAAEAAQALLQVISIGYANGVNILTEVLSAEEEYFDAERNLQNATYNYLRNLTTVQALLAGIDADFTAGIENLFTAAAKGEQ